MPRANWPGRPHRLMREKRLAFGLKSSMCVDVRVVKTDRQTTLRPDRRLIRGSCSEGLMNPLRNGKNVDQVSIETETAARPRCRNALIF